MGEQIDEFYCKAYRGAGPVIGVYGLFRVTSLACDLDVFRNILIKDFRHFVGRVVYVTKKNVPISTHLFSLEGDKWTNFSCKAHTDLYLG